MQRFFEPLKKNKKIWTPEKKQKNFALLKKMQKNFAPQKNAKNLYNYLNSNKLLTKPYKSPQKSKAEKFPSYPLTNPKKPLNFPWNSLTKSTLFKDSPSTILTNDFKGPKKLGKNHLWTNSFTPWNFSPVFSANGSWIAQGYPIIFSNKCAETLFQEVLKHPEIRFREHGPPSKNAKKCKHKG